MSRNAKLMILAVCIIHATGLWAKTKLPLGLAFEPYTFFETANYEIEHDIDKGNIQMYGIGAFIGLNLPLLYLGIEGRGGKPNMKTDNNLANIDRMDHPFPDDKYYAYGVAVKLKLWRLHLVYSYLPFERMIATASNKYGEPFEYAYEGHGYSYGVGMRFGKKATCYILKHKSNYSHFSRDKETITLDKTYSRVDRASREPLKTDSIMFTLSYEIDFDDFMNLRL